MDQYSIFDQEIGLDPWMRKPSEVPVLVQNQAQGSAPLVAGGTGGGATPSGTNTNEINSGELGSVLSFAKKSFTDTVAGWIQGMDRDGVYKWLIGGASSSIDWAVTTADTLTIVGAISATTGTIGGFNIGSDYIRDAANSMGLASTVTGGDDVRFWAGDTYANRASAPFYVTESGALVATSATINGSTIASGDVFGDGSDGDVTISADTSLTTDMYYNNLTIQTTKTLNPNGFRIFVKGTLTFQGSGKIAANGNAGTAGSAGGDSIPPGTGVGGGGGGTGGAAAHATGSLPASEEGKDGGGGGGDGTYNTCRAGSAGTAGDNATKAIAGAGSAGGGGSNGSGGCTSPGGAGAAGSASGTIFNSIRNFTSAFMLLDNFPSVTAFSLAAGSGSGGGGSSGRISGGVASGGGGGGGGSGSSGGIVWVAAKTIVTVASNNYLEAKGGDGGAGGRGGTESGITGGGGGGGGGGGRGGVIVLIYGSKTGTGTTSVTGGTGGAAGSPSFSTAVAGTNGGVGTLIELVV